MGEKILIFGGTSEARELANKLVALGHVITTSLAGRTRAPMLPPGNVHIGHFGGTKPLEAYLTEQHFERVIDATHPYAVQISSSVFAAATRARIPLLQLVRPPWQKPQAATWIEISAAADVATHLEQSAVLLVTLGAGALRDLDPEPKCTCLYRMIEPPAPNTSNRTILLARPPFDLASELALMRQHGVTHLLTKNAGGDQTRAKIDAAAQLAIPTFIVTRPAIPEAEFRVTNVNDALRCLQDAAP